MEVRYTDAQGMEPVRRTYIGTEDYLIGYKKLLKEKAEIKRQEEIKKALAK